MLADPSVMLKIMLWSSGTRTRAGVAALVAIGIALGRNPKSRSIRLGSSGPACRWTMPTATLAVESPSGAASHSNSKTTYRFPRQPIVASLASARRLRDLARSRIGGLYGP